MTCSGSMTSPDREAGHANRAGIPPEIPREIFYNIPQPLFFSGTGNQFHVNWFQVQSRADALTAGNHSLNVR